MSRRSHRSRPEHVLEEAAGLAIEWARDRHKQRRRRRKRRRGTFLKVLRMLAIMLLATALLFPALIAGGFFYGAISGLLVAPLIFIAVYSAIAWWTFGRKPPPLQVTAPAEVALLPARTEEWLEEQRARLPDGAAESIDSLLLQFEDLTPQLQGLDPQQPAVVELRRLLAEELPELVHGYQRVPRKLQQQASHGGTTPERQLIDGLETIDKQLARIHERLAAEDLRALATQQRYLELKYKGDKLE